MSKQQSEGKSCSSSWNTYQLHTKIGFYEEKSQTNELEKKNSIQNNIKNPIKAGFSLTAHTKFENKTKLQIQKLKKKCSNWISNEYINRSDPSINHLLKSFTL